MDKNKVAEEQRFIGVDESYLKELEKKADDVDYFRGRIDGMEAVLDYMLDIARALGEGGND